MGYSDVQTLSTAANSALNGNLIIKDNVDTLVNESVLVASLMHVTIPMDSISIVMYPHIPLTQQVQLIVKNM